MREVSGLMWVMGGVSIITLWTLLLVAAAGRSRRLGPPYLSVPTEEDDGERM